MRHASHPLRLSLGGFKVAIGLPVVMAAVAVLIWYIERRANTAQFGNSTIRGLGRALRWSAVTHPPFWSLKTSTSRLYTPREGFSGLKRLPVPVGRLRLCVALDQSCASENPPREASLTETISPLVMKGIQLSKLCSPAAICGSVYSFLPLTILPGPLRPTSTMNLKTTRKYSNPGTPAQRRDALRVPKIV